MLDPVKTAPPASEGDTVRQTIRKADLLVGTHVKYSYLVGGNQPSGVSALKKGTDCRISVRSILTDGLNRC